MLDAADGAASRWVRDDIDALPYADQLPPDWREMAERLVQEEMRRMTKRPKDYLAEMKPAREINTSQCPLVGKELARVAAKEALPPPDVSRYRLDPPPEEQRDDPNAWLAAADNAHAQLEHQAVRIANLELAVKFAPNAWRAHNASIDAAILLYNRDVKALHHNVAQLNMKRKLQQTAAHREITKLETEWFEVCAKCIEIDAATQVLELRLAALLRTQNGEAGTMDVESEET